MRDINCLYNVDVQNVNQLIIKHSIVHILHTEVNMKVVLRNKTEEPFNGEKLSNLLISKSYSLNVSVPELVQKIMMGLYNGVTVDELISHSARICASCSIEHPDNSLLAGRIEISRNKYLPFRDTVLKLIAAGRLNCDSFVFNKDQWDRIEAAIDSSLDMQIDYFAYKTMSQYYLAHLDGECVETPQYMFMRVALALNINSSLDDAIETYEMMSSGLYTHATPTLANIGRPNGQLASCFLLPIRGNSVEDVFGTLKDTAHISRQMGGIGLSVSNLRASSINDNGIISVLRLFDAMVKLNAEHAQRSSAIAVYLEPWHSDIYKFLSLRKNVGIAEMRTRELFPALWIPDIFMRRVEAGLHWTLFSPDDAPGLDNFHGKQFDELYTAYENSNLGHKIPARDLWRTIIDAQIETGTPYLLYKDACNAKSNQQHLGTIRCSNLCAEIVQYSDHCSTAMCNLASIAVNRFVKTCANGQQAFDFEKFGKVVTRVVKNLNKIIDFTKYPIASAKRSNLKTRPIGIGVQGLADLFMLMEFPYESPQARQLNRQIFEQMYFSALTASCDLARANGACHSHTNSPASKGILQFDFWKTTPVLQLDYEKLRANIHKYGLYNTLLTAAMPTATTAQMMGNTESFEPLTNNIYKRSVAGGSYQVVNRHLVRALEKHGLWTHEMIKRIIRNRGSVQNIQEISPRTREIFKTVWEISPLNMIDMAVDRAPFIDQSQSLSLYVSRPTHKFMSSLHIYAWSKGLKTGCYYLRTQSAADPTQFTITNEKECLACSA